VPALFYHLTRSTQDDLIRTLLTRALAQGWRVMVRGTEEAALARLDTQLWTVPEDSFLPHGRTGDQPVLIGMGDAANGAQAVILVDGADLRPGEADALARIWVIFDGADEAAVAKARQQWSVWTQAGLSAQYWAEDSGKWQMKTER
jgi:DNA polymerase III subunit chi